MSVLIFVVASLSLGSYFLPNNSSARRYCRARGKCRVFFSSCRDVLGMGLSSGEEGGLREFGRLFVVTLDADAETRGL